jgi:hypothetical protein
MTYHPGMGPTCPKCSSAAVQRQRVVYEAGTSSAIATTIGVARGLAVLGSAGKQQTELAKKVVPPEPAPAGFVFGLACFGLLCAFTGWPLFGGTLATICGLATAGFVRQNKAIHPARMARYEKKWICLACGHEWVRQGDALDADPPRC